MSNLNILPAYSSADSLHPYDLDYVYLEWGQPRKRYDRGRPWQRQTLQYTKAILVVDREGDTCYLCRNWDVATELWSKLMTEEPK